MADKDERETPEPHQRGLSRRRFLTGGALAAAATAVGGFAIGRATAPDEEGDIDGVSGQADPRALDHVVVLMGENRSFDNLLGWLYDETNLPAGDTFEGLAFGTYANTAPDGSIVAAHVYQGATDAVMGMPNPDPGEEYPHVNTQLFNTVDPPSNATLAATEMTAPFNAPPAGAHATMSGFLTDYVNSVTREKGAPPTPEIAANVMGGFAPAMLPVLSTLAKEFAVCDNWFAAVPSQTYTNRSFFHASTAHGFVTNHGGAGFKKWLDAPKAPTIFNRLEDAGLPWRVYFDKTQLLSLTGVIHTPVLQQYWKTNRFAYMEDFFADAAAGELPAYSFIEPRMIYNHNDFHPPFGTFEESKDDGTEVINSAVSDVRAGEALVASVYDAIRTGGTAAGSNTENTALIITFDEHGGTYDHVAPPPATPPHASAEPGEMGFTFDRLGLRVPAIIVSAWTKRATIVHNQLDHSAIIATLCRRHGLDPLTDRDRDSEDLTVALNLAHPRPGTSWPMVHPQWVPTNPDETLDPTTPSLKDTPLSPPGKGLLGLVLALAGRTDEVPSTYAGAFDVLSAYGQGLFTDH